MLDSIGSSVKLTNRLTSTATATVMPNGKKNLPMMPFMNATGTNTAQIANGRRHHRQADLLGALARRG
jgi:hypothetical protein